MPSMPTRKKESLAPIVEPEYIPEPTIIEEDTITFKKSHFFTALSVLTFAVGILVGYVIWGTNTISGLRFGSQTQTNGPVSEAPIATQEPQYIRYEIPIEGAYAIGPEDAPITIVEFSDYQCPFCKRWHAEVYEPLLAAYPGQIRLVYRHLPLTSIHPDAFAAAEAAMCAGEQNAYWQFHEKLFDGELLGSGVYTQYAQDLSLDLAGFETCITERTYQAQVQADSDFAINLGVNSTPTFFINGLAIVGAQPLDVFQQVIDKELAGEIPK
jgi:protein-disulfide isomerase